MSASVVTTLSRLVLKHDPRVQKGRGEIMGEDGWIFREGGEFKYAITEGKDRITLHAPAMYCHPAIHKRYNKRIAGAAFAKGCIRFKPDASLDVENIGEFIETCAASVWPPTRPRK